MRLICPNCDAQYEVDAALIPAGGRDVQCSNCGNTWFQEAEKAVVLTAEPAMVTVAAAEAPQEHSGDGLGAEAAAFFSREASAVAEAHEEEVSAEETFVQANGPDLVSEEAPQFEAAPEPVEAEPLVEVPDEEVEPTQDLLDETELEASVPESEAEATEPEEAAEPQTDDEDEAEEDGPPPRDLPRPELDAAVLGILKAEAEREIAARRAEAEAMESQPELGLSEPDVANDPIGARTRRLRGVDETESDEVEAAVDNPARKALLPDVDEINSTLTANSDRPAPLPIDREEPVETARKRRSGFRMGFSLVLLATAALIAVYLFAPELGAQFPTLEPSLAAYVDWANGVRQSVDGTLENSINALTTFLVELSS